jgi:hypothetical protein
MFRLSLALLVALPLLALAQPQKADDGVVADDGTRVTLAFDPGGHSRPISAVGFSKDGRKLITVGWDYSVRTWNAATGAQLDVLRLPPYGRDNGTDADRWPVAAVSADGRFVAVGGDSKLVWETGKPERCQLVIVDVEGRKCRRAVAELDDAHKTHIQSLAFSADGSRLVFATGGKLVMVKVIDDVPGYFAGEPALAKLGTVATGLKRDILDLGVSPSGKKVAAGEAGGQLHSWDISGTDSKTWKKLGGVDTKGRTQAFAWTPDETQVVRAWADGPYVKNRGLEFRGADLKLVKTLLQSDLSPGIVGQSVVVSMRFLDADRLFVSAHGVVTKGEGGEGGAIGLVVNVTDGTSKRLFGDAQHGMFTPFGAASLSGELAVTTTRKGLAAVVYRLSDGKAVATCGPEDLVPRVVGWAGDMKAPAIAWATKDSLNPFNTKPSDLTDGFDLAALGPLAVVKPDRFQMRALSAGVWKVEYTHTGGNAFLGTTVKNTSAGTSELIRGNYRSVTLVPRGSEPPLIATAEHEVQLQMGTKAVLRSADGKKVTDWFPNFTEVRDMVPSSDGRYVLMSTGTHRLCVYRADGSKFPFLNLAVVRGEWVLWTSEGYYTASPGGEKLIGWAVSKGPNALAEFLPADRYARHFRRPDVIKLALEKGSVKEALAALKTTTPQVESILPPEVKLTLLSGREGATVKVRAEATSGKGKPVLAMRVMLDGRPLPNGNGVWNPDGPQPAKAEFDIPVPADLHALQVMALNEDGPGFSAQELVRGPKTPGRQPTLHRVCIGVNEYKEPGLKLNAAAKDARDLFDALPAACVGPQNRFGQAKGELLVDKDVTREKVVAALEAARKACRPGDLLVVFFAGHGVKQDDDYYLLTPAGDEKSPQKGVSVSGTDLQKVLSRVECPVLLVLDSCYAGAVNRQVRQADDALVSAMNEETTGVTVLTAALAYQTAGSKPSQGLLTAGLLKGLAVGEGVPFDPYDRTMDVYHLYSAAKSEVMKASGGKQMPGLNVPWTARPIVLRDVPLK